MTGRIINIDGINYLVEHFIGEVSSFTKLGRNGKPTKAHRPGRWNGTRWYLGAWA